MSRIFIPRTPESDYRAYVSCLWHFKEDSKKLANKKNLGSEEIKNLQESLKFWEKWINLKKKKCLDWVEHCKNVLKDKNSTPNDIANFKKLLKLSQSFARKINNEKLMKKDLILAGKRIKAIRKNEIPKDWPDFKVINQDYSKKNNLPNWASKIMHILLFIIFILGCALLIAYLFGLS